MDLDLTGQVAIVTGASSGIGEATARMLADKGMKVERNIDKAAWRRAMQPVITEVAGQYGKEKVDAILGTK